MRKNLLFIGLLATTLGFYACGGGEKKNDEQVKADSIRRADSIKKVEDSLATLNKPKNIIEMATADTTLRTLVTAIGAADLAGSLSGTDTLTVFAPTNQAFAEIQKDVEDLLKPENKEKLQKVLKYHVIKGAINSSAIAEGDTEVETLEGKKIKITKKDGKVMVNGATVVKADEQASNGYIHEIDKVLKP